MSYRAIPAAYESNYQVAWEACEDGVWSDPRLSDEGVRCGCFMIWGGCGGVREPNAQRHTNGIINRTELATCTSRLKTVTSRYTYLGVVTSAVLGARSDVGTLVVM
jgi:hypothetical protein